MDEPQATDRPTYSPDDLLHDLNVLDVSPHQFARRTLVSKDTVYRFLDGAVVRRSTRRLIAIELLRLQAAKSDKVDALRADRPLHEIT